MSKRWLACIVLLSLVALGSAALWAANDESEGYQFTVKKPAAAEQGEILLVMKAEVKTPDISLDIGGRIESDYALAPAGDNVKITVNSWNVEGEFKNLQLPVELGKEIELIKADDGYSVDFMGNIVPVPVFVTDLFLEHSVRTLLPEEKMTIGQSVKIPEAFVQTWLNIERGYVEVEELTGDLTLKKVERNGAGHDIATLEITDFGFSVKHENVGHTMKIEKCGGVLRFDLTSGRPVNFEAEAAISFHGIFGGGQETSEGTISLVSSFK